MRTLLLALGALVLPAVGHAQSAPPEPVRVLLLGSYHFANPGQDVNNVRADDVLTPARQAELARLADALATFRPTAVALEREGEAPDYRDPKWPAFTPAELATTPNERVQIGYRLAARAGIDRVYAIDEQPAEGEPDYFPYGRVQDFMKARGRAEELERLNAPVQSFGKAFEAAQADSSIAELLAMWNTDRGPDAGIYDAMLLFGEGEEQPGPDLLAGWYLRNAKIVNKLAQVTRPGDRVVVVYGAGHLALMRQMIADAPGFELEPVLPYLDRAR